MFSIITICTENYRDAIDFSIPSWLALKTVTKIYIYTDFELEYPDNRVVVIKKFLKNDKWLDIVGAKPIVLKSFILTQKTKNIAFVDIDCYITEDISEVFDNNFDIAATRMGIKGISANSGVWFCRNNERTWAFSREWKTLQEQYRVKAIGTTEYAPSYSQLSFSHILHRELKNKTYLNVYPISAEVYNNEADLLNDWIDKIKRGNYKILHFKGRRWRDQKIVNTVMTLCKNKILKEKIAVYTVIIGKFNTVKPIRPELKDLADYYLFTDQDILAPGYIIKKVRNESGNARRESRKYKIQPEKYLSGYDYFLYLDGSMELLTSPQLLVNKYLKEYDIAVLPHPWYDCIYLEFKQCLALKYVDPETAKQQEAFYRVEGYPEHNGLTENGAILRRNNEKIQEFNKFWKGVYDLYTNRDQLSFCYCVWRMGMKYNTFEGQTSNPALLMTKEFKLHKHGK